MEPLIDGIGSYSKTHNYASGVGYNPSTVSGAGRSYPPSMKSCRYEGASTASCSTASDHGMKTAKFRMDAAVNSEEAYKTNHDHMRKEPSVLSHHKSNKEDLDSVSDVDQTVGISAQMKLISTSETLSYTDNSMDSLLEAANLLLDQQAGGSGQVTSKEAYQPQMKYCPSPQNSFYSAIQFTEAKESFTCTEVSESVSAEKSGESYEVTTSEDVVESRKTSICRGSTGSDVSDESSSSSSLSSTVYKPHKANDTRWEAIKAIRSRDGALGFNHFRLLKRLGCGDIGSVYLSELSGTRSFFAMKVMDKAALASRKKLVRVQTEREILQSLDHPFLPTLYAHFETEKFSCLVMEFCPGGDLHALRQRQPGKYFPEHAVRFYVAEVLLALEYLHMLGIIYRDLKPENVLVRDDGHIMLSDFDLSLRCAVSPTLVRSSNSLESKTSGFCVQPSCVVQPACIQPACFTPRFFNKQPKKVKKIKQKTEVYSQSTYLPELVAEPTSARSMSFVGTHEYLAPEIVKGEGHGSAVDWWTFGIFLYELLFGRTPFKGQGNRATLFNVVGQPLRFPEQPSVSFAARDLIRGLLVKEPQHRLAYRRGATEIKQHPFFQNVNWALIRCANPPDVPKPYMMELTRIANNAQMANASDKTAGVDVKPSGNYLEIDFF